MREKQVPASMEYWDEMSGFLGETLSEWNCPPQAASDLETALEEIFTNVASYAYPGIPGDIAVWCEKQEALIRLHVWDQGIPYNPLMREEPDLGAPIEEREPGGLGIYMVKKLMHTLEYEYRDGCNHLIMGKYTDSGERQSYHDGETGNEGTENKASYEEGDILYDEELGRFYDPQTGVVFEEDEASDPGTALESLSFDLTLEDGRIMSYEAVGMFLVGERQYMAAKLLGDGGALHLFSMKEGPGGWTEIAYVEDDEEFNRAAEVFEALLQDEEPQPDEGPQPDEEPRPDQEEGMER